MQAYWDKRPGEMAAIITNVMDAYEPDATFVDAAGLGAGIYDMIRHTNHYVIAANGAHAVPEGISRPNMPSEKELYYNMRACMWGRMKDWLSDWGCLPQEYTELAMELQAPQWTYAGRNQILLESKDDMRARGVASPDAADSLSLTFYAPVRQRRGMLPRHGPQQYATPSASPLTPRQEPRRQAYATGGMRY
jgi:phage terminase large subunit